MADSGNLSTTSQAWHLSAHAVGYRLERITQLTRRNAATTNPSQLRPTGSCQ